MEMEAVQRLDGRKEQRTGKKVVREKNVQKLGYKILKRIFDVVMSPCMIFAL